MISLTATLKLTDDDIAKLGPVARAQIEALDIELKVKPEVVPKPKAKIKETIRIQPEAKMPGIKVPAGRQLKDMSRLEFILFELACTDADSHKAVERSLDTIINRQQYPQKPAVVIRSNLKAIAEAVAWLQQKIGS